MHFAEEHLATRKVGLHGKRCGGVVGLRHRCVLDGRACAQHGRDDDLLQRAPTKKVGVGLGAATYGVMNDREEEFVGGANEFDDLQGSAPFLVHAAVEVIVDEAHRRAHGDEQAQTRRPVFGPTPAEAWLLLTRMHVVVATPGRRPEIDEWRRERILEGEARLDHKTTVSHLQLWRRSRQTMERRFEFGLLRKQPHHQILLTRLVDETHERPSEKETTVMSGRKTETTASTPDARAPRQGVGQERSRRSVQRGSSFVGLIGSRGSSLISSSSSTMRR